MYIKLCDRCGKQTSNGPAFLTPTSETQGSYRVNNTWFGEPVCLCEECLEDFNNFRYNHKKYKIKFIEETNEIYSR